MKSLDSSIYKQHAIIESRATRRLYGDSWVSRVQPRINSYEILLQHDWLLIFSRQNRFAETHSHLQLLYHITNRPLAAGNKISITFINNFSYYGRCVNYIGRGCNDFWPNSHGRRVIWPIRQLAYVSFGQSVWHSIFKPWPYIYSFHQTIYLHELACLLLIYLFVDTLVYSSVHSVTKKKC